MPNKYRKGGVKAEHTIIDGIGNLLAYIAACPYVHAVTPGRISRASMGPSRPQITFQYFQDTGLKLIGKTSTAVQEVFVVSSRKEEAYDWLVSHQLITVSKPETQGSSSGASQKARRKPRPVEQRVLVEASEMTTERVMNQLRSASKLSPITPEQKAELEEFKSELEAKDSQVQEARKHKQGKRKQSRSTQKQHGHSAVKNQSPTTMQDWLREEQRKDKSPARKGRKKHPPKHLERDVRTDEQEPGTMQDWLTKADSKGKSHWDRLLDRFGKKED